MSTVRMTETLVRAVRRALTRHAERLRGSWKFVGVSETGTVVDLRSRNAVADTVPLKRGLEIETENAVIDLHIHLRSSVGVTIGTGTVRVDTDQREARVVDFQLEAPMIQSG